MVLLELYWHWVWIFPLSETPEWWQGLEKICHPRFGEAVNLQRENFPIKCLSESLCKSSSFHVLTLNICIRCEDENIPPLTRSITHFGRSACNFDIWLTFRTRFCLLLPVKLQIAVQHAMFFRVYTWSPSCSCTQAHRHVWSTLQSPCLCCQANTLCWHGIIAAVTASPLLYTFI